MFTTQHYKAIAELLGKLDSETRTATFETHGEWQAANNAIADVIENFTVLFGRDNPLFDGEAFVDAVQDATVVGETNPYVG